LFEFDNSLSLSILLAFYLFDANDNHFYLKKKGFLFWLIF